MLILLFTGVVFTACEKRDVIVDPPAPKTLNELNAPENFPWSTGMPVEVTITGLPTVVPVKSTLTLSRKDGSILFSGMHLMSSDAVINLIIPSAEKELVLKYGTTTATLTIAGGKAAFSFIPVIEE